ncbi:MAG: Fic family protein [Gemmatimonadota bacterium]
MQIPMRPPSFMEMLGTQFSRPSGPKRLLEIVAASGGPAPEGKYRHWDILRHLKPPRDLTVDEWWFGVKFARQPLYHELPLRDTAGAPFRYAVVDPALRMLHHVDKNASGAIRVDEVVTNPGTRDTYLVKSLMEEAITSSQLEGASTTRAVAKDMLQRGLKPRDRSQQMIYNNYVAMQFIRSLTDQPLTPGIVLELQRLLTVDTLDDPGAAGRLRLADEPIVVADPLGKLLHTPPLAEQLSARLALLCDFANGSTAQEARFVHPVLRAIILHFWLAYDHPFVDGNGRTARALFYWCMATQGYWLSEFVSISRILKRAPTRYARAFLYAETDDNDVTYFILNQLRVLVRAIQALHEYLAAKATEVRRTETLLQHSGAINAALNHRQLALLNHALNHQGFIYTFESHRRSHHVSYQTARTDLLSLAEHALLERRRRGRTFVFLSPPDLKARLERMGEAASARR